MMLAHLGLVVSLIGILMVSTCSEETTVKIAAGQTVSFAGYQFTLNQFESLKGPNYVADQADIAVYQHGKLVAQLKPEKRFYEARRQVMTEASLDAGMTRDIYVSLGEKLDDQAWSMRIYVKAFVRWIWFGGILMMCGGVLSALDKRYRNRVEGCHA